VLPLESVALQLTPVRLLSERNTVSIVCQQGGALRLAGDVFDPAPGLLVDFASSEDDTGRKQWR